MIDQIKKIKKNVRDFISGATNNIDKLMTDKVDDYVLLEEIPMPIQIGERTIYVGNLTFENEYKFFRDWAKIIGTLGLQVVNFDLLAEGGNLYQTLMLHKSLFRSLCKLLYKTIVKQQGYYLAQKGGRKEIKWKNCSLRYFIKNMTKEKLIQICYLIYIYNFDSVKKNLQVLLGTVLKGKSVQQAVEIYMYSWLQNFHGATGKFLLAQAPSIDYAWRDTLSDKDKVEVKSIGK